LNPPIGHGTSDVVLPKSVTQFTKPHRTNGTKHHWLLAPSVACVITVSVNSLLSNLPVIYAICVALMTNLVAASIFMASNLDFRLYFTVFIVIVFASLLVGAVLEIHNSIALWRTFPFQEEVEETIIAPKLRPWDEGNYGFPKGGAQFERILQAEKALVASRRWREENQGRDFHEEAKGKQTLSKAVQNTVGALQDKKKREIQPIERVSRFALEDEVEVEPTTLPLAIKNESDSEGNLNDDSPRQLAIDTEQLPGIVLGSPTHSSDVVQGSPQSLPNGLVVRGGQRWAQTTQRHPSEWQDGIPPPRTPTLEYRPVR